MNKIQKIEENFRIIFDTCVFFRLAKLMKSLARWEITLSALICLIPLRPNLSKKTKHFTLTLPNSYLSKCFFLVETKNVSVQMFNIFFVFRLFFENVKKGYLKSVCNKVNLFSFCRLKWLHLEKCSRNEFFPRFWILQNIVQWQLKYYKKRNKIFPNSRWIYKI